MDPITATLAITAALPVLGGVTGYTWGYETPLACPGYHYDQATCEGVRWAAFPVEWYESGEYR